MFLPHRNIRLLLLHEYRLGHDASESTRNICHIMGEGTLTDRSARNQFEQFRNNDFNFDDEDHFKAELDHFFASKPEKFYEDGIQMGYIN
jgi:hypothetical protein